MRSVKAALVALVFLLAASEASAQVWGNQPAGSTVLTDCAFPLSNCAGWYDGYGTPYATDLSDPVSPPMVADFFLRYVGDCSGPVPFSKPCAIGGGQFGYLSSTQGAELYIGVMLKLNSGYGCSSVGTSKSVFLRAFDQTYGGPRTNGVWTFDGCGATKRFIFSHNTGDQAGYPALHNEHACPQDPWNGLLCYPNVGPGTFQRGTWVKFEACVKASTNMTSRDAIVKWWVDGVLAGHYTNLNYGQGLMNQFDATPTWDGYGNGQGFTADAHQYYGHVRVARVPNGGCASGTGGGGSPPPPTPTPPSPTPPPPTPTGNPGTVSTLSVTPQSSTSALVSFTAVDDGAGAPAKYDNRLSVSPISWGSTPRASSGACASPFAPAGIIGSTVTCLLTGLTPGQSYQLQNVAFRGTMNAGAIYGGLSNVASFTMPSSNVPAITNFTPASGVTGISVTISGSNFSATPANNTVKFNGQPAVVTAASTSALTVTVPDGVTTGRISIQTDQGIVYSDQNFSVGASGGGCGCS